MFKVEYSKAARNVLKAMMNVMEINGVKAVIVFDPEINMFRGEFVDVIRHADDVLTR